jgi:hypothetical protein
MKNILGTISILFLSVVVFGQAKYGNVEIRKVISSEPAVFIYLPYSPAVVNHALNAYVSNTIKADKTKDYLLASNTELAKNNTDGANFIFNIGLKDETNPNETVVYMKLNSTVEASYPITVAKVAKKVTFDEQQAIDFLNNFAIAIQPYATNLQIKTQKKNLQLAQEKYEALKKQGIKLEQERQDLINNYSKNTSRKISRRQLINHQKLETNQVEQAKQMRELDNQKASFASSISYNK